MPREYEDAQVYALFGGVIGMNKTSARIVLRQRLRIRADNEYDYELEQQGKRDTDKARRDAEIAKKKR